MLLKSQRRSILKEVLNSPPKKHLRDKLSHLHPAEIADLIEALPSNKRSSIWSLITAKTKGEILLEVRGEVKKQLINLSSPKDLKSAVKHLQIDEIADLDERLPESVIQATVKAMDSQTKKRYERVKDYPDDTAGGLMDLDAIAIRSDITIDVALRYLRLLRKNQKQMPEHLDSIYVVDRFNHFLGTIELRDMISLPTNTKVSSIIKENIIVIPDTLPAKKVAKLFEDKDLLSAPIVNASNELLGRVTVDDVIDVIRKEAEKLIMRPAGLSEKTDIFSPVIDSVKFRAIWHGINLINAFVAALTISLFTNSIEKIVSLAILMPVVASMGGVAGNQTLTLVTRGIALDQITKENRLRLLTKEAYVGLLNGTFWAVVVAALTYLWLHDLALSLVFAFALLLSLLLSATAGTLIPLVLNRLKIDPALAGSVILVAVSDVAGFFIFLSIATLFLA